MLLYLNTGYTDPDPGFPDADPDANYLNKGYADTDADVCNKIISLCCTKCNVSYFHFPVIFRKINFAE